MQLHGHDFAFFSIGSIGLKSNKSHHFAAFVASASVPHIFYFSLSIECFYEHQLRKIHHHQSSSSSPSPIAMSSDSPTKEITIAEGPRPENDRPENDEPASKEKTASEPQSLLEVRMLTSI
jgi:hypothetical protein